MDKHYLDIGYNGDRAGYSFGGGEPDPPKMRGYVLPVLEVYGTYKLSYPTGGAIESVSVIGTVFDLTHSIASDGLQTLGMGERTANITAGALMFGGSLFLGKPKFSFRYAAKGSTVGLKSVGAASKNFSKVLQSGGQSLKPNTLKALNLSKEQGRNAIHGLKSDIGLPNNFHGKIMGNGDYLHPSTDKWLGNLFNYTF